MAMYSIMREYTHPDTLPHFSSFMALFHSFPPSWNPLILACPQKRSHHFRHYDTLPPSFTTVVLPYPCPSSSQHSPIVSWHFPDEIFLPCNLPPPSFPHARSSSWPSGPHLRCLRASSVERLMHGGLGTQAPKIVCVEGICCFESLGSSTRNGN